jgi:uncharacterized hydrophobic protein (TIGR00271 family)
MGVLSGLIDAGGEHRSTLADVEQELFVSLGSRSAKITRFWVLLVLASVIAAGGVVGNSTPAVIGAMIMTPLATPLYGVALSAVLGERRHLRDAILLLAAGVVVSVLIGVLMALLTFDRMPLDANTQIVGRTAPAVLDLVIAIAAGLAGAYALVRRDVANILAGVAIAITLVPVLEVAGISLGSGRLFARTVAAALRAVRRRGADRGAGRPPHHLVGAQLPLPALGRCDGGRDPELGGGHGVARHRREPRGRRDRGHGHRPGSASRDPRVQDARAPRRARGRDGTAHREQWHERDDLGRSRQAGRSA